MSIVCKNEIWESRQALGLVLASEYLPFLLYKEFTFIKSWERKLMGETHSFEKLAGMKNWLKFDLSKNKVFFDGKNYSSEALHCSTNN